MELHACSATSAAPIGEGDKLQDSIGLARIAGLPVVFLIAAAVVLVFGVILAYTRFGEHTFLVGSNELLHHAAAFASVGISLLSTR